MSSSQRSLVREIGLALITAGVVVLLFVAYELVGTNFSEQRSQTQLARQFRAAVGQAVGGSHGSGPKGRGAAASPGGAKDGGAGQGSTGGKRTSGKRTSGTGGKIAKRPSGAGGKGTSGTGGKIAKRPSGAGGKGTSGGQGRSRGAKGTGGEGRHPAPGVPAQRRISRATVDGVVLPVPPPGGALDHLVIPAIGLDRYVVQGVGEGDLQMGPGHYPATPLPGQVGNVAIAGHRTTFGAPFFRLNELVRGDLIYLTDTSSTTWVYRVVRQWVVAPSDLAVLTVTPDAELTLTTCNPRFDATSRLVVRAVLAQRLSRGTKLPGSLPVRAADTTTTASAPPTTVSATTVVPTTVPPTTVPPTTVPPTTVPPTTVPPTTTSQPPATRPSTISTTPSTSGRKAAVGGGRNGGGSTRASVALGGGGAVAWSGTLGWGALVLVMWVAARLLAARRKRYAGFALLLTGALACLVPLWFTFENLVNLLPANL